MDLYDAWLSSRGLEKKVYQREGVAWCLCAEESELSGGFLADEMGLGKTIAMIGLGFARPVDRTLIVVPCALVEQWKAQLRRLDGRKLLVWHKGIKLAHLLSIPIVIATYGKLAVTKKRELSDLHKVEWGRIIFDEAHHMRNKKTGAYMGGKLVRGASKWLVTGTPIQNCARDFNSLCAVLGIAASKTYPRVEERIDASPYETRGWAFSPGVGGRGDFCSLVQGRRDPVGLRHSRFSPLQFWQWD